MRSEALLAAALSVASAAVCAAAPVITVEATECLPAAGNGVVNAKVQPDPGGTTVRLSFRPQGDDGPSAYVDMTAAGDGAYWGVLPPLAPGTAGVEYSIALLDAAGNVIVASDSFQAPVARDCPVELTPEQRHAAEELAANPSPGAVPWWKQADTVAAAVLAAGGSVFLIQELDDDEASPARP